MTGFSIALHFSSFSTRAMGKETGNPVQHVCNEGQCFLPLPSRSCTSCTVSSLGYIGSTQGAMHQQVFSPHLSNVSIPWHFWVITVTLAIY